MNEAGLQTRQRLQWMPSQGCHLKEILNWRQFSSESWCNWDPMPLHHGAQKMKSSNLPISPIITLSSPTPLGKLHTGWLLWEVRSRCWEGQVQVRRWGHLKVWWWKVNVMKGMSSVASSFLTLLPLWLISSKGLMWMRARTIHLNGCLGGSTSTVASPVIPPGFSEWTKTPWRRHLRLCRHHGRKCILEGRRLLMAPTLTMRHLGLTTPWEVQGCLHFCCGWWRTKGWEPNAKSRPWLFSWWWPRRPWILPAWPATLKWFWWLCWAMLEAHWFQKSCIFPAKAFVTKIGWNWSTKTMVPEHCGKGFAPGAGWTGASAAVWNMLHFMTSSFSWSTSFATKPCQWAGCSSGMLLVPIACLSSWTKQPSGSHSWPSTWLGKTCSICQSWRPRLAEPRDVLTQWASWFFFGGWGSRSSTGRELH